MKSKLIALLCLPALLAGCSAPSSSISTDAPSSSKASENQVVFYRNADSKDDTVLYTLEKDASGLVKKPYVPVLKNYVFEGWFTAAKEGEEFDFNYEAPSALYAHWSLYQDLSDAKKVSRYVNRISEMCPKVSETRGFVQSATTYSTAEGTFITEDRFTANRYEDVVVIDHYYPKVCYSESDLSAEEKAAGKTVESVNQANRIVTEQDFFEGSNYYQIYDYNERHPNYDSESEDGKVTTKANPIYKDSYFSIDFAAYFMGWLNQLGTLLSKYQSQFERVSSIDEGFGDNTYWIKEINVSNLDESASSQAFGFAYSYSYTGNNDATVTQLFQSNAEFAIVDGKIRHCQVTKIYSYYLNGDCMMAQTSLSLFDFNSVEEYEPYKGTRFDPADYDEYED